MINLALATILLPFLGAVVVALSPQPAAKTIGRLFAGLSFLSVLTLAISFARGGMVTAERALVRYGDVEVLGFAVDKVSVLVAVAVVAIGLLVTIYSVDYFSAEIGRAHV